MTSSNDSTDAWLETTEGREWPIGPAGCSIGRAPTNRIVLGDQSVSRKHAIVHRQDGKEFWVVDLGSGNGSFVNGLRVVQPTRLRDGDQVRIGATVFTFRHPAGAAPRSRPVASSPLTVIECKSVTCWMLVADIIGSTGLAAKYAPERWAALVGAWTGDCQRIIEASGGTINKHLGDGFLALWPRDEQPTAPVTEALGALVKVQGRAELPFRIAVHYGDLMVGGARSFGEDNLSGLELVLLFRMEKIAGTLRRSFLCSERAAAKLRSHVELEFAGEHPVSGFIDDRPRRFYGLKSR